MNNTSYINHETSWLSKAQKIMLQEMPIHALSGVEQAKYKELVNRVLQGELDFLIEAPEEYQELYGGNELRMKCLPLHGQKS